MSITKATAVPSRDTHQLIVLSMVAWLTLEQACIPSIRHQATHVDNLSRKARQTKYYTFWHQHFEQPGAMLTAPSPSSCIQQSVKLQYVGTHCDVTTQNDISPHHCACQDYLVEVYSNSKQWVA